MRDTRATNRNPGSRVRRSERADEEWLARAAEGASKDAGGVPVGLLGDYLPMLADAATHGQVS